MNVFLIVWLDERAGQQSEKNEIEYILQDVQNYRSQAKTNSVQVHGRASHFY